jgi:hypothetical protein
MQLDLQKRSWDPMRLDFLTGREYFINFSVNLPSWLKALNEAVTLVEPYSTKLPKTEEEGHQKNVTKKMRIEDERVAELLVSDRVETAEDVLSVFDDNKVCFENATVLAVALAKLWNHFQANSHYYAFDHQVDFKSSTVADLRFAELMKVYVRHVGELSCEQVVILCLYSRWMGLGFESECFWRSLDEGKKRRDELDVKNLMRLLVASSDRLGMTRLGNVLTLVKNHLEKVSGSKIQTCHTSNIFNVFNNSQSLKGCNS